MISDPACRVEVLEAGFLTSSQSMLVLLLDHTLRPTVVNDAAAQGTQRICSRHPSPTHRMVVVFFFFFDYFFSTLRAVLPQLGCALYTGEL